LKWNGSILSLSKKTLKDDAAMNGSRKGVGEALIPVGKKGIFWRGAQIKCHPVKPCLAKEHGRCGRHRSFGDNLHHFQGNLCVKHYSDPQRIASAMLVQSFWLSTKHGQNAL